MKFEYKKPITELESFEETDVINTSLPTSGKDFETEIGGIS